MKKLFPILLIFILNSCCSIVSSSNAELRQDIMQKYLCDSNVNQFLTVSHLHGSKAKVMFYIKQDSIWNLQYECEGFVGKSGMGKTKEGDMKTPLGDFEITSAFGILPNPGTVLPYIRITPSVFACDENCEYYNRIIDTIETGHNCRGENMYNITPQYNYGLCIGYNEANVYPSGSAIFLHCIGDKNYTAGCVAISEPHVKEILEKATPGIRIYLDEYYIQ